MKIKLKFLCFLCAPVLLCACASNATLPRAASDEQARFTKAGSRVFDTVWGKACNELHSLMILQDGKVVYERWANGHTPSELHIQWSVSKTFTAIAVGYAVADGVLSVDDKVVSFFADNELPAERSEYLENLTVRELLTMTSGWTRDIISRANSHEDFDWAKEVLASQFTYPPTERFFYNSSNSYLLSVIVSRAEGQKVVDILGERLFKPLGIDRYIWEESPQGYNSGGWGLYLTTESMAKIGQLLLQKGVWCDKQVIDSAWVKAMTSPQFMQYLNQGFDAAELERLKAEDDWNQGYGYQTWCCLHNAARADGAFGQYIIVIPDKNAVVVTTAHAGNSHALLDSIWKNIYPLL